MPDALVSVLVPDRCTWCTAEGRMTVETFLAGSTVSLHWCCRFCGKPWPIAPGELTAIERRKGSPDHRPEPIERRKGTPSSDSAHASEPHLAGPACIL